jgi:Domain of unknown function (DUF4352)
MQVRRCVSIAVLAPTLLLAACGDDGVDSNGSSSAERAESTSESSTPPPAESATLGLSLDNPVPPGAPLYWGDDVGDAWKIEVVDFTVNGRIPSDKPKEGNQFVIVELRMTYIGEHENAEATGSATDFDYSLFTEEGQSIPNASLTPEHDLYSNSDIPAGIHLTGNVAFEVPSDEANGLTFYVRTDSILPDDPGGFFALG